jgi:hypothetical protein
MSILLNSLIPTAAYETFGEIFSGESVDYLSKIKIGYGTTTVTYSDTDLEHPYTDGGFGTATVTGTLDDTTPGAPILTFEHEFTNTSGSPRIIREAGIFFNSGDLAYRRVYANSHLLNNFSVVPAGGTVTVEITITFGRTSVIPTYVLGESTTITYTINISPWCDITIDGDTYVKMQIGYGYTPVSESDTGLESEYTDYGFAETTVTGVVTPLDTTPPSTTRTFSHTFTNSYTDERVVREVAVFSLADEFLARCVFQENDIQNLCLVPESKDIDISVIMTFSYSTYYRYTDATGDIDLTTFDHPAAICYNGNEAPNAGIETVTNALGMKTWVLTCSSQDRTLIDRIIRYAGPVTVGESITGNQYVVSAFRSGVLYIKDDDSYYNVYMIKPVKEMVFGDNRLFEVEIIQSAYEESV